MRERFQYRIGSRSLAFPLRASYAVWYTSWVSKAEILEEIVKLSPEERDEIRRKLDELDDDAWDRQIEADARSGKLDRFIAEAIIEHRAGKSRPFP